jgi:hypothetical protein
MPKKPTKAPKRRTQVKESSKQEKELTSDQQGKVKSRAKQIMYSGDSRGINPVQHSEGRKRRS